MSSPDRATGGEASDFDRAMRTELDRRIGELDRQVVAGAGPKLLGAADGLLIGVLFLLVPALLVYLFR